MMEHSTAPQGQPTRMAAGRLLATLAGLGAVAGALIVFVFQKTQPTIQAYRARMLQEAVREVLHNPARYDTLYLYQGRLFTGPPGGSGDGVEAVYRGFDGTGATIGYAIAAGEPGFQDVVRLLFGYDAATGAILGMKVLESKETPGLGDKIEKDQDFVTQFQGALSPLIGRKPREVSADDRHEVAMITGATISSRTVIRIINNAVERWAPALTREPEAAP